MAHLITKVFEPSRTQQKIANNYPIRLSSWTPATMSWKFAPQGGKYGQIGDS